jgi:hypothetical protein
LSSTISKTASLLAKCYISFDASWYLALISADPCLDLSRIIFVGTKETLEMTREEIILFLLPWAVQRAA